MPDDRAGAGEVVAAGGLGDPEVGDLHRARPSGTSTFAGLTSRWTMPAPVRGVERVGDLAADARPRRAPGARRASSRSCRSVGPVDQLHDDVGDAVVVAGVVGGDDVRVGEAGGGDRLVAEPGPQRRRRRRGRRGAPYRDPACEHRVVGDPHRGHAAAGERLDEPVAAAEDAAGLRLGPARHDAIAGRVLSCGRCRGRSGRQRRPGR